MEKDLNYYKKLRFFTRYHSGGFIESLETTRQVNEDYYKKIANNYEYYAYDERINAITYKHKNPKETIQPMWLFITNIYEIETYLNKNNSK